jgi:hypothetical protein
MATYKLVTTRSSGGSSTYIMEYPSDDAIIADARKVVSGPIVAISIGRQVGVSGLEDLGTWQLGAAQPEWMVKT